MKEDHSPSFLFLNVNQDIIQGKKKRENLITAAVGEKNLYKPFGKRQYLSLQKLHGNQTKK